MAEAAIPANFSLSMTAISNGGFGLVYGLTSGNAGYLVYNSSMNLTASGILASSTIVDTLVGTSDGGILASTTTGSYKVSATGIVTTIYSYSATYTGENHTYGSNAANKYRANTSPNNPGTEDMGYFGISSGGYGLIESVNGNAVSYYQFNADGTARGTVTTLLTGLTSISKLAIAVGGSGNICWMHQHGGGVSWGIVSDSGTIVKAATLIASSDTTAVSGSNSLMRLIADANGDFFMVWPSSSMATFNNNYVTASAGTSKSGFPRSDVNSTSPLNCKSMLYRLSTGIVHIMPGLSAGGGGWALNVSMWSNTGTSIANRKNIVSTPQVGYFLTNTSAFTTFNDTLYGFVPANSQTIRQDTGYFVKIDNAANVSYAICTNTVPNDVLVTIYVDANDIIAQIGTYIFRARTSDLQILNSYQFTTHTYPGTITARFILNKVGNVYVITYNTTAAEYTSTGVGGLWNTGAYKVKAERSNLVGVAAANSVAGGPVLVQTKGHASTSWNGYGQTAVFDQTANNPAGQKGTLSSGFITLGGI